MNVRLTTTIIFLFILGVCKSQDTVSISFKPKQVPTFYNQGRLIDGVTSPNNSRLDLFDKNIKLKVSIPTNFIGTQSCSKGTEYYLGISTYNGPTIITLKDKMEYGFNQSNFNEVGFIQCKLPANLGEKEYWVTYKVSLADYSKYATSGWGAYFSEADLLATTNLFSTVKPQVTYTNTVVKDKQNWVELAAKFKSTGKEKFITIGCFEKGYKFEEVIGGKEFGLSRGYYYISDIKLIEIPSDIDKDGIIDRKDRCPEVFGLAKYNGCPDTDGDSIPDPDDICPTIRGLLAFRGCPDTDGDGIEDSRDKCPTVFGTTADQGCPHVEEISIDEKNIQSYISSLKFETSSDALTSGSYNTLDKIANAMKADPFIEFTIIEFLDEGADAKVSKPLSDKRAAAIKTYLFNKGCDIKNMKYSSGNADTKAGNNTDGGRRTEVDAKGNKK